VTRPVDTFALWWRWSWRDLRGRWLQVLAIAAIIAIGTGLYASLTSSTQWRRDSYAASYAAVDAHDVVVRLSPGTSTSTGTLRALLDRIGADVPVAAAVERLSAPTQVDASTAARTLLVSGRIIGVEVRDGGPAVDRVGVLGGRGLTAADDGQATAVVDVHFARRYDLPDSGTVRLGAGREITYVGHGEAPEQFLSVTDAGTVFAQSSFAVFYTSLATAQDLLGTPGQVNELAVRFAPGVSIDRAADALRTALGTSDLAATVVPLDEDRVHVYLYNDIDGDQRFFDIFAVLILGGASFAAFNLTGRMVESQRREFGIGMALGANRALLALRPMLVALQIVFGGVVLGVLVGVGFDALMRDLMAMFLPLPIWRTAFQPRAFAKGATLGLAMPLVATIWPVVRATRVAPVDALRTAHLASTGGAFAPLLRRLRLPGDSMDQMPLRDVVRAPRRTVLTVFGIATAVATLVVVMGTVDTFSEAIDRGEREILAGDPTRMTVDLTGFVPLDSATAEAVTQARTIALAVPALQVGGRLSSPGGVEPFDVFVTLLDFTNPVWAPTAVRGSLDRATAGIVISEKAAADLRAGVGDVVTLVHPRRADTGYTMVASVVPVVAIHPNPYRFVAFMDLSHADLLNLTGVVNMFEVVPAPGASSVDVQRELFGTPGVAAAQPVTEVVRSIRDFIGSILDILGIAQSAVVALAVLIAFNSSSISADERRRQHATMFAFGIPVSRVVRNSFVESIIIGVLSTVLGIALGYAVLTWIVHTLLPDTVPEINVHVTLRASSIGIIAALGVAAVAAAPLFTIRRLRRMPIPDTLRVQE
jgi:putative ABC transport system permease protein